MERLVSQMCRCATSVNLFVVFLGLESGAFGGVEQELTEKVHSEPPEHSTHAGGHTGHKHHLAVFVGGTHGQVHLRLTGA
jgi:hypothetical protein